MKTAESECIRRVYDKIYGNNFQNNVNFSNFTTSNSDIISLLVALVSGGNLSFYLSRNPFSVLLGNHFPIKSPLFISLFFAV